MAKKKVKKKKTSKKKQKIPLPQGNKFLIPRYIMTPKRPPICPTFITDETTGLMIVIPALVVCLIILWRVMLYYGR